jgi:hypothetical protein
MRHAKVKDQKKHLDDEGHFSGRPRNRTWVPGICYTEGLSKSDVITITLDSRYDVRIIISIHISTTPLQQRDASLSLFIFTAQR